MQETNATRTSQPSSDSMIVIVVLGDSSNCLSRMSQMWAHDVAKHGIIQATLTNKQDCRVSDSPATLWNNVSCWGLASTNSEDLQINDLTFLERRGDYLICQTVIAQVRSTSRVQTLTSLQQKYRLATHYPVMPMSGLNDWRMKCSSTHLSLSFGSIENVERQNEMSMNNCQQT